MGSQWVKKHLPSRKEKNAFFTRIGRLVPPGTDGLARLKSLDMNLGPEEVLQVLAR